MFEYVAVLGRYFSGNEGRHGDGFLPSRTSELVRSHAIGANPAALRALLGQRSRGTRLPPLRERSPCEVMMSFVRPGEPESAERTEDEPRDELRLDWADGPISLSDAIRMHDEALTAILPALAFESRLSRITERIQECERTIRDVEQVVDALAAVSELNIVGECPECVGTLRVEKGNVECATCGHVVAEVN